MSKDNKIKEDDFDHLNLFPTEMKRQACTRCESLKTSTNGTRKYCLDCGSEDKIFQ